MAPVSARGRRRRHLYFDALGDCVPELWWRLLRPDQALETFQNTCTDLGRVVLDEAGEWIIEIYSDTMGFGSYEIEVIEVPARVDSAIEVGQTRTGEIASIGEWHRYSFNGTSGRRIVIDALGECVPELWWRLLRPDGTLEAFDAVCADSREITLTETGAWAVEIYSDGIATGDYSLALRQSS